MRLWIILTLFVLYIGATIYHANRKMDYIPTIHKIIEIEGCEYIIITSKSYRRGYMAHKGNCKYCVKRLNKK